MIEGYGVDPDVPVRNDPQSVADGHDLQLDKAIEVALAEAREHPRPAVQRPPGMDRSGEGVQPAER
jgi:C-terminal processing protease CtpA/Prc